MDDREPEPDDVDDGVLPDPPEAELVCFAAEEPDPEEPPEPEEPEPEDDASDPDDDPPDVLAEELPAPAVTELDDPRESVR